MKAYHIDRFGSVGGIVRRSSEDPRPGLKEVLMRVRASSLNYRDLMVLKGGGRGPTKIGVVPLSDGAGEVAAIGEGVTRVKIGDRIAGCFHPRWFGGPIKPDYLTDRLGANLDGMPGYGSVSQAMSFGIPLVTAGLTEDKADVNARVAWSGVGIDLATNEPTPQALREAVRTVLDKPNYRSRASLMADAFAEIDTRSEILRIVSEVSQISDKDGLPQAKLRKISALQPI